MGRRANNLLWFDSGAGATAGVLMLLLHSWLVELHRMPASALWAMAAANLGYACYSGRLALRAARARPVSRLAVDVLILANIAWSCVCCALLLVHRSSVSSWGIGHLLAEGAFVAVLGALEYRFVRPRAARAPLP